MDLTDVMQISAAGMKAQGLRMRVIAENLANANTTGTSPGAEPYRRQVVTFRNIFDRELQANLVEVSSVRPDSSQFGRVFDPSHPAADKDGYVLTPNVRTILEMQDFRQAQRSYEANLAVIELSRMVVSRTVELLRG